MARGLITSTCRKKYLTCVRRLKVATPIHTYIQYRHTLNKTKCTRLSVCMYIKCTCVCLFECYVCMRVRTRLAPLQI